MEEVKDDIIHKIETGEILFNDVPPKPRIPYEIVKSTIEQFRPGVKVKCYPGNTVELNNVKYHYYAQYNSGNTDIPWYGITKNVCEQLGKKITGIILIYIKTLKGNIQGDIQSRYYLEVDKNIIKTFGKEEDNRFLLNFKFSTTNQTFVIEKNGNDQLKMSKENKDKK